jgi:succinyl-CoA synthetase alpha subunit
MPIIATEKTVALVQGITGSEGVFRTKRMLEYGTKIVAGCTPGKGGQFVHGVPVYDSVAEAKDEHPEINTVVQLVPARFARDATLEAIDAGIPYIVVVAEGIPFQDVMEMTSAAREKGVTIVGPNTAGVISPGICELGATAQCVFHGPGKIGVISCTGSIQWYLTRLTSLRGWGQSTFVDVGGDPIRGIDYDEVLLMFEKDPQTEAVLWIGEIGGDPEMRAAKLIEDGKVKKPLVAYIYGRTAPPGRRLGHAGAIIERGRGDVKSKVEALRRAGATVIAYPWEVVGAFEQLGLKPIPELLKKPIREAEVGR